MRRWIFCASRLPSESSAMVATKTSANASANASASSVTNNERPAIDAFSVTGNPLFSGAVAHPERQCRRLRSRTPSRTNLRSSGSGWSPLGSSQQSSRVTGWDVRSRQRTSEFLAGSQSFLRYGTLSFVRHVGDGGSTAMPGSPRQPGRRAPDWANGPVREGLLQAEPQVPKLRVSR
jgi:hypothetical protein